jgi:hypothetical protein
MRIVDIEKKYFSTTISTFNLLESYNNPAEELDIEFTQSKHNPEVHYEYVQEKSTGQNILELVFTLNDSGVIDLGTVIPNSNLDHNKKVYTSQGEQYNGADMGFRSIRWIKEKIKIYAVSKGFDIKQITTSTKYTGARAKNNPNQPNDMDTIKQFNISRPFRESITLDFRTGNLTRKINE